MRSLADSISEQSPSLAVSHPTVAKPLTALSTHLSSSGPVSHHTVEALARHDALNPPTDHNIMPGPPIRTAPHEHYGSLRHA